jgi:hypothetical protein
MTWVLFGEICGADYTIFRNVAVEDILDAYKKNGGSWDTYVQLFALLRFATSKRF